MISANQPFFIYGTMTDRNNRTECTSLQDVMAKFKEVVRVYRQRGNEVKEAYDRKWLIIDRAGKTEAIWIEDPNGKVVPAMAS